ncbi:hypothetical protein B0H66DRAFT_528695 [Apodospora peruviana]|uniref:Secreted protein n=1 Tax=Apodospora peruviana TaxID=516989 RepID=A0AAE0IU71_9PEZI|nr:hypothetical protein B0H66DRAFT_528695 [Apodospora peruviana]
MTLPIILALLGSPFLAVTAFVIPAAMPYPGSSIASLPSHKPETDPRTMAARPVLMMTSSQVCISPNDASNIFTRQSTCTVRRRQTQTTWTGQRLLYSSGRHQARQPSGLKRLDHFYFERSRRYR